MVAGPQKSLTMSASVELGDSSNIDHHDAVMGSELLTELQARSAVYRDGTMMARPAADVMADLRRRQAGKSA